MSREKLTEAQIAKLATVPEDWATIPIFGDHRPIPPLLRLGMIEQRKIDETPPDWYGVHLVRHQWRITDAGRRALSRDTP